MDDLSEWFVFFLCLAYVYLKECAKYKTYTEYKHTWTANQCWI